MLMHIDKENIIFDDEYMSHFEVESRDELQIESLNSLDEEADRIQKAKGKLPLFDDSGDYDSEDWYEFFFTYEEGIITGLYFQYGISHEYGDEIKIDEETKLNAQSKLEAYMKGRDYNI